MSTSNHKPLEGKRVLYVGVGFFSYDLIISQGIRDLGAEVEVVIERPHLLFKSNLSSILNRLTTLRNYIQGRHERRLRSFVSHKIFDVILVIKGDSLGATFFEFLREINKNATFILYQWDSINLIKDFYALRKPFDRCLTFDRRDAEEHEELIFRPLFYSRKTPISPKKVDGLVFIGSLHSDRLSAIRRVVQLTFKTNVSFRPYICVKLLRYVRLVMTGRGKNVYYRPLPYDRYVQLTEEAECVLDLPHPSQTGLTMRTIEALGLGTKIITTNKEIVNYEFYDPANVTVISLDNPSFPKGFFNGQKANYPKEVLDKYTLEKWLSDVFDLGRLQ